MFENDLFFEPSSWDWGLPLSSFYQEMEPGFPLLNIWSGPEDVLITAEIPGVDPSQIDISVTGDTLTLRGERVVEPTGKDHIPIRRERESGRFVRTLQLPFRVNNDKIDARYSSGVLHLTLPRPQEDKPRKISVKASH